MNQLFISINIKQSQTKEQFGNNGLHFSVLVASKVELKKLLSINII